MCLSSFCVLRGLFCPGCCKGHTLHTAHTCTHTHTHTPRSTPAPADCAHLQRRGWEWGGGFGRSPAGGRSPPSPRLRLHKASRSPPPARVGRCTLPGRGGGGGQRRWRLQAELRLRLFEICLLFSHSHRETGGSGLPFFRSFIHSFIRPSAHSLAHTSANYYAPTVHQAPASFKFTVWPGRMLSKNTPGNKTSPRVVTRPL